MATSAAAMAVVSVATWRQSRARLDSRITLAPSVAATAEVGGATVGEAASGSTIGACCSDSPAAALIFCQTSGRGSTDPTIWFKTPSFCSHAVTSAVKSWSPAIMVSTMRPLIGIKGAEGIFCG